MLCEAVARFYRGVGLRLSASVRLPNGGAACGASGALMTALLPELWAMFSLAHGGLDALVCLWLWALVACINGVCRFPNPVDGVEGYIAERNPDQYSSQRMWSFQHVFLVAHTRSLSASAGLLEIVFDCGARSRTFLCRTTHPFSCATMFSILPAVALSKSAAENVLGHTSAYCPSPRQV